MSDYIKREDALHVLHIYAGKNRGSTAWVWLHRAADHLATLPAEPVSAISTEYKRLLRASQQQAEPTDEQLEAMVEAYEGYQLPADQGLAQQMEGMRLALKAIQQAEPFVVKHYGGDAHPSIKGNGFDGLLLGENREEAEDFIEWVNARLLRAPQQQTAPAPPVRGNNMTEF